MNVETAAAALSRNVARVVRGKPEVIDLLVVCLLAEGHVLIEDKPGVGKTTLARALAHSLAGSWGRIQFTPDLLPSDVTGSMMWDQGKGSFTTRRGPIFNNIVVADEINRASAKTQSALLQVMEERQATIDLKTYDLPRPFVVVATQNPIEMDGTYRLPEAQLDRFLMRIEVGYPSTEAALEILKGYRAGREIDELPTVMSTEDVQALIRQVDQVNVSDAAGRYIVALGEASRQTDGVQIGVSPRGCLALMRAARARAAVAGRDHVIDEDVKALAVPVLAHRLILTAQADLDRVDPRVVVRKLLERVDIPRGVVG